VRELIPGPGADRYLSPELAAAAELVVSGQLVHAVQSRIGALQ
jgi:histidine ammonia-lyase